MDYGWISLLPIITALILAFVTKDVFTALLSGVIFSGLILSYYGDSIFVGLNSIADVFLNGWAVRSILFCLMIGSFVHIIEASGGIRGLLIFLSEEKKVVKSRRGAELIAYIIGLLIFIEGTSSTVISGISAKPFFDKYDIPREKLAYITDSTSSSVAWLFPINAAGAFLMTMIGSQISAGTITGKDLKVMSSFTADDLTTIETASKKDDHIKKPRARNMIFPTLLLITSIFVILYITGNGSLSSGKGADAIFNGIIITLILTGIYYVFQGIVKPKTYIEWCIEGMTNFLQITIVLVLAFALGNLTEKLNLGSYIAEMSTNMNPVFLPAVIFLMGSVISFATGTSGGTAAILIPIAIPMAAKLGVDIHLTIGAVVSSAVFGDHCSPISDSTILASMISEVPVMNHVKTQMPYALISGGLSMAGFLIMGVILI